MNQVRRLAASGRDMSCRTQRMLAERIMPRKGRNAEERIEPWIRTGERSAKFVLERVQEMQNEGGRDFVVLAARELRTL